MTAKPFGPVLRHLRRLAAPAAEPASDRTLLERFTARHDEAAFSELVRRHGPLVQGVCRRLLGDIHAAEDAFQATFLLLATRAGSLRRPESVGCWLHGVARRVALRARVRADRLRRRERRADVKAVARPAAAELSWREVCAVLDDELARLPERYRAPLVLCYLEGRTRDEAAKQLGWSVTVLRGRLERGRDRLRQRLTRRGLGLEAALLVEAVAPVDVSAGVVEATVRAVAGGAARSVAVVCSPKTGPGAMRVS
jgi:RNA polymerase sigma factor (sigma-70 family)